jgi:hypothetical protein
LTLIEKSQVAQGNDGKWNEKRQQNNFFGLFVFLSLSAVRVKQRCHYEPNRPLSANLISVYSAENQSL